MYSSCPGEKGAGESGADRGFIIYSLLMDVLSAAGLHEHDFHLNANARHDSECGSTKHSLRNPRVCSHDPLGHLLTSRARISKWSK